MKKKGTVFGIELSAPDPGDRSFYHTELLLPAEEYEILDALQRVRAVGREKEVEIELYDSPYLPGLTEVRLEDATIRELNLLAGRLADMDHRERLVFGAVIGRVLTGDGEDAVVRMKELINSTYGLERVRLLPGIATLEQLGDFVMENGMNKEVELVPDAARHLLDKEKIGRIQKQRDGGVFAGGCYVAAGAYEPPEIYDGITLPEEKPPGKWVFRLLIAEAPVNDPMETAGSAEWIALPMERAQADRIAALHNEKEITDCVYYDLESVIPQITPDVFQDMLEFDKLNDLVYQLADMPQEELLKFKAVLCAGPPEDMDGVLAIAENLPHYELSVRPDTSARFMKEYLRYHLSGRLDSGWLEALAPGNESGKTLLNRLGATVTPYGVVSAPDRSLFEPVPYREQEGAGCAEAAREEEDLFMGELRF